MLLGNAGIVTAVSSLILTFVEKEGESQLLFKMGWLLAGVMGLWALAMSSWVDRWLSRIIDWALNRYTSLETKDYASLMHLAGEYRLVELLVKEEDWVAGKTLAEANLWNEGFVVLGITRSDGRYVGVPRRESLMNPGDTLILYGRDSDLRKLDERKKSREGDREHEQAIAKQQEIVKGELAEEKALSRKQSGVSS
jgi:Trk K+ transport system NAD-binding subunit